MQVKKTVIFVWEHTDHTRNAQTMRGLVIVCLLCCAASQRTHVPVSNGTFISDNNGPSGSVEDKHYHGNRTGTISRRNKGLHFSSLLMSLYSESGILKVNDLLRMLRDVGVPVGDDHRHQSNQHDHQRRPEPSAGNIRRRERDVTKTDRLPRGSEGTHTKGNGEGTDHKCLGLDSVVALLGEEIRDPQDLLYLAPVILYQLTSFCRQRQRVSNTADHRSPNQRQQHHHQHHFHHQKHHNQHRHHQHQHQHQNPHETINNKQNESSSVRSTADYSLHEHLNASIRNHSNREHAQHHDHHHGHRKHYDHHLKKAVEKGNQSDSHQEAGEESSHLEKDKQGSHNAHVHHFYRGGDHHEEHRHKTASGQVKGYHSGHVHHVHEGVETNSSHGDHIHHSSEDKDKHLHGDHTDHDSTDKNMNLHGDHVHHSSRDREKDFHGEHVHNASRNKDSHLHGDHVHHSSPDREEDLHGDHMHNASRNNDNHLHGDHVRHSLRDREKHFHGDHVHNASRNKDNHLHGDHVHEMPGHLDHSDDNMHHHFNQSPLKVWGSSILAVLFISLVGLGCVVIIPVMRRVSYNYVLQFLVAVAVGALTGDALLHLLPHAMTGDIHDNHEGTHEDSHHSEHFDYHSNSLWMGLCGMGGLITFFTMERLLRIFMERRTKTKKKKASSAPSASTEKSTTDAADSVVGVKLSAHEDPDYQECEEMMFNVYRQNRLPIGACAGSLLSMTTITHPEMSVSRSENQPLSESEQGHGHSHLNNQLPTSVATIAWMVILGDGIHNFSDGLALGAGFANSITGGISTTIAIFCHELPHEMGDFAVLLQTGMSVKQAIIYNCVSSVLCFFGMVIGVVLGNVGDASLWIFACIAGTFLYIALVDMLPELCVTPSKGDNPYCILGIQLLGIMVGASIMAVIAVYEHSLMMLLDL
ncbi:zinc transporter ZIP6-like [Haliotis asinina]|uniref:zinc transporter ZIP6-like n=1 Tax=Haliotis asinina TaxID=109174 RepID=UPI003531CF58